MSKLRDFVTRDHRYVLLGTSAVALVGMLLSSSPRPAMSFLAQAFAVELAMYYVLAAWLVVSGLALLFKLTHWRSYAETSPLVRPGARRALRCASYVVWAIALVLVVDRLVMGLASAWSAAVAATERFLDNAVMAKLEKVTIIHGKGTGALRAAVQQSLRKNKAVKSYRLGRYGEGESGVTVVELK